jgi:hypothetical protein
MPNIARAQPRPPVRASAQPKTKILLVRQPVKSVRRSDEGDRTPVRLAIGVIVALGTVGVVWLMGYLGWRLGFAPIMRVPDLSIESSGGIATGVLMLIGLPRVVLEAGIEQPMWLMAGMALICVPAACLGAVKTPVQGGPKLKPAVIVLLYTGAVFAMLNAFALMWWTISPLRGALVTELPFDPSQAADWLRNLRLVGGLDTFGVIAAAVWVVLAMRLPIAMWLRALSSTVCMFVLVVMTVAFAISNATIAQITADRSVYFDDEGSVDARLIVGNIPEYLVSLHVERGVALRVGEPGGQEETGEDALPSVIENDPNAMPAPRTTPAVNAVIEMSDRPARLTVVGRQSIVDYMIARTPREE